VRILNGVDVYDITDGDRIPTEILSSGAAGALHTPNDLALLMDGTTQNMDEVHKIQAATTGGVGGAWVEESNWHGGSGVLARKAPNICEAVDNLLADEDASFEGGTVGNHAAVAGTSSLDVLSTDAYHGSKCLRATAINADSRGLNDVTAITANAQYTASCFYKAGNAAAVGKQYYIMVTGDVTGIATGPAVTLTTEWQLATHTHTWAGDSIRRVYFYRASLGTSVAGDELLIDGCQLEQRAYATPFALDSRVACTMTFPTAGILTAGQPLSIVMAVRTFWPGNDGKAHYFFDNVGTGATQNSIFFRKTSATNRLEFYVYDNAFASKYCREVVDGTDWPADTSHIVALTRTSAGVLDAYLNDVQFTDIDLGAGTGLETVSGANIFIGTRDGGSLPTNGAILLDAYNRVLSRNEISLASAQLAWAMRQRGF